MTFTINDHPTNQGEIKTLPPHNASDATYSSLSGERTSHEVRDKHPASGPDQLVHRRRHCRVRRREVVNFTSQLAIMTRSGVDVATALHSLARQCRQPALRDVLEDIHRHVVGGKSFSEALRQYDRVFGNTYIASVAAGEASGRIAVVLSQLAKLQRSELRRQSTIRTLLAYPVLLTSVSGLVILALILFVLPQFAAIFEQFDTPLPLVTQCLIAVANELRGRIWLWGPLLLLVFATPLLIGFSGKGLRYRDYLLLHLVFLGDVVRMLLIGRVCRLLGLMIESGVPMLESLRLARSAAGNSLYRDLFVQLEEDVINGRGLGPALLASQFIPPSAAEMIVTAERTGNLGAVTQLIGEHFEEEGEIRLRELVTILEPVITVMMGLVVAVVVLSIALPMFDLATFAQHGY